MTARARPKFGEKGYERVAFDNYRTPTWVTDCLVDAVSLRGPVWEPACGDGDMAKALWAKGFSVKSSDIRSTPYNEHSFNFLSTLSFDHDAGHSCVSIVTNPPYALAESFIENALAFTKKPGGMVAMLLAHEFDAPAYHRPLLDRPEFSMKLILPRRIRWLGFEDKASPRQVHAWYVWDWQNKGRPTIRWANV